MAGLLAAMKALPWLCLLAAFALAGGALLLGGCGANPVETHYPYRAGLPRPIPLALDHETLSICHAEGVLWAGEWWEARAGIELFTPDVKAVDGMIDGAVVVVGDAGGTLQRGRAAETIWQGAPPVMRAAAIVMPRGDRSCHLSGIIAAHELGHVLGLAHQASPGMIMSDGVEHAGMVVSDEELDRVRRNRPTLVPR